MKEKRKLNKTPFVVLGIVFIVAIILAAAKIICTSANNVSIGWVEHKQSDLWEADYSCSVSYTHLTLPTILRV